MPAGERVGLQSRGCTTDFKIRVIQRELARRYGKEIPARIFMWIGISKDEWLRMKPSKENWIKNIWPLVEKNIRRQNCIDWMRANKYPKPPRSACIYCPYHGDVEWLRLKSEEPNEFQKVIEFEKKYQSALSQVERIRGIPFLHRTCVPIGEIDFDLIARQKADEDAKQPDFFGSECEGMCGV